NVAKEEMFGRAAVCEVDPDLGSGVRHDHQIAAGAKRRLPNRTKGGHHQIRMCPADPFLPSAVNFLRRKPLSADMPGDVAGGDEEQFLTEHAHASYLMDCGKLDRARLHEQRI